MKLLFGCLTLFTALSLLCIGDAAHIRSAGRWRRALAASRLSQDAPALGMRTDKHDSSTRDMDMIDRHATGATGSPTVAAALPAKRDISLTWTCPGAGPYMPGNQCWSTITLSPTSVKTPPATKATTTPATTPNSDSSSATPTQARLQAHPIGLHKFGPEWLPAEGVGVEIYKMVTPTKPQPYTSNGSCVNMLDYRSRDTAYIVSSQQLARGLACKFYYLPDCQEHYAIPTNGSIAEAGYWNASQLFFLPLLSSFQCWPKECNQPIPPFDFAVTASPTLTCAESLATKPVGFDKGGFYWKYPPVTLFSATTPTNGAESSSITSTTTTTVYTTLANTANAARLVSTSSAFRR